jgi:hypothetical protein
MQNRLSMTLVDAADFTRHFAMKLLYQGEPESQQQGETLTTDMVDE